MRRSVLYMASAALSGVIFGFGLAIARMIDTQKIKDFLDFTAIPEGGWDPSLIFVMGGGVLVGLVGLRLDRFFRAPIASSSFIYTSRTKIDRQLAVGSAVFGVGCGLSGFCPGPAIANLGIVPGSVLLFVVAMLAGSWVTGAVVQRGRGAPSTASQAAAPG